MRRILCAIHIWSENLNACRNLHENPSWEKTCFHLFQCSLSSMLGLSRRVLVMNIAFRDILAVHTEPSFEKDENPVYQVINLGYVEYCILCLFVIHRIEKSFSRKLSLPGGGPSNDSWSSPILLWDRYESIISEIWKLGRVGSWNYWSQWWESAEL